MKPNITRLTALAKPFLVSHLKRLNNDDRRMRFGMTVSDEYIEKYVGCIDFTRDEVFGIVDNSLRIVACSHFSVSDNAAELGLSVDLEERGSGYGLALFERAVVFAKSKAIEKIYMVCLSENKPIMHLARKLKMTVVSQCGEADAHLQIDVKPIEILNSAIQEKMLNQIALWDIALNKVPMKFVCDCCGIVGVPSTKAGHILGATDGECQI